MENDANRPTLLLHACCAPCAPHIFNTLSDKYSVAVYFYNPNIQPETEYIARKNEIIKFSEQAGFKLIVGEPDSTGWNEAIKGYEPDPEGGERCRLCFRHRLEHTAREAAQLNFDFFATTLSISPHKNAKIINEEGSLAASKYGLRFLEADFKKRNGFKISCELSREHGFFRQDYCGCLFSRRD
ncbi:MAG: epoxyqueuosine reductase QueH [bacterium]